MSIFKSLPTGFSHPGNLHNGQCKILRTRRTGRVRIVVSAAPSERLSKSTGDERAGFREGRAETVHRLTRNSLFVNVYDGGFTGAVAKGLPARKLAKGAFARLSGAHASTHWG